MTWILNSPINAYASVITPEGDSEEDCNMPPWAGPSVPHCDTASAPVNQSATMYRYTGPGVILELVVVKRCSVSTGHAPLK